MHYKQETSWPLFRVHIFVVVIINGLLNFIPMYQHLPWKSRTSQLIPLFQVTRHIQKAEAVASTFSDLIPDTSLLNLPWKGLIRHFYSTFTLYYIYRTVLFLYYLVSSRINLFLPA